MPSDTPTPLERPSVVVLPPTGRDTSEYGLTKLLAIGGTVIAASFPVLTGLTTALDGLQTIFPGGKWIGAALGVLSSLLAVSLTVNKYIGSRTQVKIAEALPNKAGSPQ